MTGFDGQCSCEGAFSYTSFLRNECDYCHIFTYFSIPKLVKIPNQLISPFFNLLFNKAKICSLEKVSSKSNTKTNFSFIADISLSVNFPRYFPNLPASITRTCSHLARPGLLRKKIGT